ncbi:MAG: xylulokinase [Actinomycetota bacterium]|nr:xylulokinase [Actinomycetota bacterium]
MQEQYIIGTDIGTSGCKSILIDSSGKVIASAMEEYPLYTPRPGWAEQNPDDWWEATAKTIRIIMEKSGISPQAVKGIGLSGQMHGLVALDKDHQVVRPAYLWNDQRSHKQCQDIYKAVGGKKELLKYTNNSMLPGYTGGKILWLKQEEPRHYEQSVIFLNPKDYIRFRLTGEFATEVSDASGTGLFDVKNRKWSQELLEILDIPLKLLPKAYESPEITGYLTGEASEQTGLPKSLPVAGGGGDAVIQTTGTGLIIEGILGITLGTAGVTSMGLNNYTFNHTGNFQVFCSNAPNKWNIMGVTLAAGGSFQWFKNKLCRYENKIAQETDQDVYKIIDEAVEKESEPGSKGLVFLPYLIGERCPYPDPNASGVFIGVTLRHNHEDFARSVMEGVTFSQKQIYELMTEMDTNLQAKEITGIRRRIVKQAVETDAGRYIPAPGKNS